MNRGRKFQVLKTCVQSHCKRTIKDVQINENRLRAHKPTLEPFLDLPHPLFLIHPPIFWAEPHLLLHPCRTYDETETERSLYSSMWYSPPVGILEPPEACASTWSLPTEWRTPGEGCPAVPCCPYRYWWGSPQGD